MKLSFPIKASISLIAVILLLVHVRWPLLQIDSITVSLAIVAMVPWILEGVGSAEFMGWKVELRNLEHRQGRQQDELNILKFMVAHFVTRQELAHLKNLANTASPFLWHKTAKFEEELRHLRDLGFVSTKHADRGITDLMKNVGGDVHQYLEITPSGKTYLAFRDAFPVAQQHEQGNSIETGGS